MRVLILTADLGEGHDLPARVLRDGVHERRPDAHVVVADTLEVVGPLTRAAARPGTPATLTRLGALVDLQYWLGARVLPTRVAAQWLLSRVYGRRLLAFVTSQRPDVVVCTYPLPNEALSHLRLTGRLAVPVVSAITDLAALRYWAHRGCDLHLVVHPESAVEVRAIAGPRTRVEAVRGLTRPAFDVPVEPAEARARLGLPTGRPLVVVSGGGWGVGDLDGAVEAALRAGPDLGVVALCGRNEPARAQLDARYGSVERVTVLGFTERMPDLLGAADVLVHATAGLTVFEALVRGARPISFGWGVAHIRLNNRAYRRLGLADVVADVAALTPAIRRALASPRRPDLAYGARPAAADRVIALAEAVAGLRVGVLDPGDGAGRAEHGAAAEHQR